MGGGYSVCDFCPGALDKIKTPPIFDLIHRALLGFLDIDAVRITNVAREAKFAIMHSMAKEGARIVLDKNAQYTSYVAAQRARLTIKEVPNSDPPHHLIDPQGYAVAIEEVISQTAKDGRYFLYRELKRRNIHGIKPGHTGFFKLSTFGLSREELEIVADAFEQMI